RPHPQVRIRGGGSVEAPGHRGSAGSGGLRARARPEAIDPGCGRPSDGRQEIEARHRPRIFRKEDSAAGEDSASPELAGLTAFAVPVYAAEGLRRTAAASRGTRDPPGIPAPGPVAR